jgi:hypothetical protein
MKRAGHDDDKKFSEATGKLHIHCPHREKTGINVHVVIRGGVCYKAGQCLVVQCKYNTIQNEIGQLLSLTW